MYIYLEIYWFERDWHDFSIPCEKTIPSSTPKPVMLKTSSMVAAAITRVGIPLSSP